MHLDVKCLPFNSRGIVAIGDVTPVSIDTIGRAGLPYPPGKVQVNGNYWPTDIGAANAVLTWTHRNRFTLRSLGRVVQQDEASQGAVEGTYTIQVLLDGVVQGSRTQTGLTGTTFTYTLAENAADDPGGSKLVSFKIWPINGSKTGRARETARFAMG